MERGFLSSKGCGGGRGVKEKSGGSTSSNVATNTHGSTKDTTQVTAADGPVLSRSGGHMVDENVGQTPSNSTDNPNKGTSYANLFTDESCKKSVNFCTLFTSGENKVDVIVLVESIRAISERFANTAYGFFLEKHVAYPVVANYVRNTWGKYGLVKSMLNSSTRIFTFHFNSLEGLDAILENGPWFIRNNPLILKKWNPDDGLSAIATKIGTPLMLDSYTSDMCIQSWGRSSYVRALIEVRVDVELKDIIVVAMPKLVGGRVLYV
ncbi:putative ribonuclease H-like domain-containing protein [Tanacetum coccineum]